MLDYMECIEQNESENLVHFHESWADKSFWLAGITGFFMALSASAGPAPQAPSTMHYFRAKTAAQCNVYMNYSFYEPHFSLKARDPATLTPDQRDFVAAFNAAAKRSISPRLASACQVPWNARLLSQARQAELYAICVNAEKGLGISEENWRTSHVPAPSNCISPKLASAGTVSLIPGALATPAMSLDGWMQSSLAGR